MPKSAPRKIGPFKKYIFKRCGVKNFECKLPEYLKGESDPVRNDFSIVQTKNFKKALNKKEKSCYVFTPPEMIVLENTTITEVNKKHNSKIPLLPVPRVTPQEINIINQVHNDVTNQNITVNTVVFNELVAVLQTNNLTIEQCVQYFESHGMPEEMRLALAKK
jgi:hypothetical protein